METAREIWDNHCSYQWVYFPEEAKQLIQFFLLDRIHGKNLDLGAGWYAYHPNSTVVDFSSKGLEYNLAKEKILFDLDSLGNGGHLPLPDKSHDSATLVSVWQYLRKGGALLKELERVLVPGSEVFIINHGGSGLTELCKGSVYPSQIEEEVRRMGYDCIREVVPFGDPKNPFESVTLAMPETDLFGKRSLLRDAEKKLEESKKRVIDPEIFYGEFAAWETERAFQVARKLETYPITRFSKGYQERVQSFADDIQQRNGIVPLIFLDWNILPSLHLITDSEQLFPTLTIVGKGDFDHALYGKYNLHPTHHLNYFYVSGLEDLENELRILCREFPRLDDRLRGVLDRFSGFLASIPLTEETKSFQNRIYNSLKGIRDFDRYVLDKRKRNFHFVILEGKQRRKIGALVAAKERILAEGIPTIGCARFDYHGMIRSYRARVRKDMKEVSKAWLSAPYDD